MARTRSNASDLALEKILHKVNNYELSSGDIVSDLELSRELNMSRTPIREAISRLIDAGVLERTTTKVIVKAVTLDDINEILAVKEAIELMSARLIIEQGGLTSAQIEQLESLHEAFTLCASSGQFEDNYTMDSNFHITIITYSKNSRLIEISKQIDLQIQRVRWINILTPSQFAVTVQEHSDIINALKENDLSKTEQIISLHTLNAKKNYAQIISNPHWSKLMKELLAMKI